MIVIKKIEVKIDTTKKIQPSINGYGLVTIAKEELKEPIGKTMRVTGTLVFEEVVKPNKESKPLYSTEE